MLVEKRSLPLCEVYRLIEPGLVVLVSTMGVGRANIMTMSWHMMVDFEPPPSKAAALRAPLIDECYANLECKVIDTKLVTQYGILR